MRASKKEGHEYDYGERHWRRGRFRVEGDPVPNDSIIGRVRVIDEEGIIVCFKTKAQVDWLIRALAAAKKHAFGNKR